METGYDIIFLWVARMIMMGLYCVGEIPYSVVYLHGTVRNEEGKRMSKSLGTGIDPLEVVDRFGADALRYALITASGPGNDLKLSMQRVEMSRNFANKLWNATRFVLSMIGDEEVRLPDELPEPDAPVEDRWIVSRVEELARSVDALMRKFEMGEAARQVYEFVWNDFCDWYIEMAKVRVRDSDSAPSPLPVLAYVLDRSLRLLHPVMPFVTEELWQALHARIEGSSEEALIVSAYPRGESGFRDEAAERELASLIDVVRAIRNIRAEKKVEPGKFIEAYVVADGARPSVEAGRTYIEALARVRPLHVVGQASEAPREQVATAVLEGLTAVVPLAGLFNTEAERARLAKQISEGEAEQGRLEAKLANQGFRSKAPANVVEAEEVRLESIKAKLDGLRRSLGELG
jgi:valyl-tRNA synthetase